MEEQHDGRRPQSRVRRGPNTFWYIAVIALILCVFGFFLLLHMRSSTSIKNNSNETGTAHDAQLNSQTTSLSPGHEIETRSEQAVQGPTKLGKEPVTGIGALVNQHTGSSVTSPIQTGEPQSEDSTTPNLSGNPDQFQQQSSGRSDPQQLINQINAFYTRLDQRPYMQNFDLKEPSKAYFSKLLQKVVNNPPVVVRETDDLYTLLRNTAHFFRILGKNNINILKEILTKEQNSSEQILKAFYDLTAYPAEIKKEYAFSIPPDALTDYAAFFLNTMGGRLYLFRRDSKLRMIVSYYAIVTIARAKQAGNEKHGIDLRPAIHSLIEEMENSGGQLQLKEQYLDVLYDLQEKYN